MSRHSMGGRARWRPDRLGVGSDGLGSRPGGERSARSGGRARGARAGSCPANDRGGAAIKRLLVVLTAAVCLALPAPAVATGTLDQQQTSFPNLSIIQGPQAPNVIGLSNAQTFTAGLTGDLDQVDLALLRIPPSSLDLIVEIRSVSAGAPDGVLASATIAAAAIPASPNIAFVSATFSPPAPVTKDNQYAIVAYASGSDNYGWGLDISNPYAGGQFFGSFASPPAAWSSVPEWDHAFKTYVVERFAFTFTGFLTPVENPPTVNGVNSGAGVPLEFSLGGDQGLDIFRPGFPQVQLVACPGAATNDVPTTVAGNSSLQYNPRTDVYTYVWKTDKAWAGQCGQLELGLIDGSTHTALFQFR